MKRKIVLSFFILFILFILPSTAYGLYPVENLTATPFVDKVYLEWDSIAGISNYSICFAEPTMYYANWTALGISPPTIDGVFDDDVGNFSQEGILRSPNPVDDLDYEQIYAVHDDDYIYMGAKTHDNDAVANDDYIEVYFDFAQDGLDTTDIGYQLRESGTFTRLKWSGSAWISYGGSGALSATSGEGTANPVYELRIPKSELPNLPTNDTVNLIVRRTNTDTATTYTYFPDSTGYTIETTDGWQEMLISNVDSPEPTFTFYTENNYYNVTGLDAYSWYKIGVSAIDDSGVEGDQACVEFITLDYPRYNIYGTVYADATSNPLSDVLITVTDTFTHIVTTTNSTGEYSLVGLHNDEYTITYTKDGYVDYIEDITISSANVSGIDIYMQRETVMVNIMNVPISIYVLIVFTGLISGAYAILRKDNEYYTHLIACIISALLFATSSYISFAGVTGAGWSDGVTMPIMTLYTLPSLGYLFAGVAAILVFYFFMRMYDIYQENADAGWMKQ
jgi:hypothetical protein